MKEKKGSTHLAIGAAGIAIMLLVLYVLITLASPDTGNKITGAIAQLVSAFK